MIAASSGAWAIVAPLLWEELELSQNRYRSTNDMHLEDVDNLGTMEEVRGLDKDTQRPLSGVAEHATGRLRGWWPVTLGFHLTGPNTGGSISAVTEK